MIQSEKHNYKLVSKSCDREKYFGLLRESVSGVSDRKTVVRRHVQWIIKP